MTGGPENNWRNLSDETGRWLDVSICSRCGTNLGSMLETAPWIRTLPVGLSTIWIFTTFSSTRNATAQTSPSLLWSIRSISENRQLAPGGASRS